MCKINNVALALEICAYFLQEKMAFQLIKLCQESQLKLNTDCHQASRKQNGMGWQLNTTDCANSDKESLYSCTTQCGFQAALHTLEARALCTGKLGLHPHQKNAFVSRWCRRKCSRCTDATRDTREHSFWFHFPTCPPKGAPDIMENTHTFNISKDL